MTQEFEEKQFQLEQDKLTLEKAKHIDGMRFQTASALYKQLFTFNIAILTLIAFGIYQTLEYNINIWFYLPLLFASLFSTASMMFLVNVHNNARANLSIELDAVFQDFVSDEIKKIYEKRQQKNIKNSKFSYLLCILSWLIIITIIIIFLAFFKNSKKDKENNTIGTPYISYMSQNNISHEIKSLEPTPFSAFAMANLGKTPITSQPQQPLPPQQPQAESTTKQPLNKQ